MRGIRAVLNFPITDAGRLRSIVLLTDGYIGNENQILAEVQQHLKPGNRLYSFGAGSSVNRFLLNRIAEIGRGLARIIRHDEPVNQVVEQFFRQINNPVLTNIQWQWLGEGESPVIYPSVLPDLFAEQPLVLFGRKSARLAGKLQVSGIAAGGTGYQQTFELNFQETGNPAIAQLWGRSRIKALMNQMVQGDTKAGVEAVIDTALKYQLLSQYTAFVAVSDDVRVNPQEASVSVQVPVEMPDGISYEGIFGGVAQAQVLRSIEPAPKMAERIAPVSSYLSDFSVPPPAAAPMPPGVPSNDEIDKIIEPIQYYLQRSESLSPSSPNFYKLKIVKVTGLDASAIALLTQHLESVQLLVGATGDVVFEFDVDEGRVRRLVVDETLSSLPDKKVVGAIRRALLRWRAAKSVVAHVCLVIQVSV